MGHAMHSWGYVLSQFCLGSFFKKKKKKKCMMSRSMECEAHVYYRPNIYIYMATARKPVRYLVDSLFDGSKSVCIAWGAICAVKTLLLNFPILSVAKTGLCCGRKNRIAALRWQK